MLDKADKCIRLFVCHQTRSTLSGVDDISRSQSSGSETVTVEFLPQGENTRQSLTTTKKTVVVAAQLKGSLILAKPDLSWRWLAACALPPLRSKIHLPPHTNFIRYHHHLLTPTISTRPRSRIYTSQTSSRSRYRKFSGQNTSFGGARSWRRAHCFGWPERAKGRS